MDDDIYHLSPIILFVEQSRSAWLTFLIPAWDPLLLHVQGKFALADWNMRCIITPLTLLLCQNVMWCYAVYGGFFLACSSGIYFYISDIVQTNYLAYGMLQVHMICQDAVMPTEYDNDGAINFLS